MVLCQSKKVLRNHLFHNNGVDLQELAWYNIKYHQQTNDLNHANLKAYDEFQRILLC